MNTTTVVTLNPLVLLHPSFTIQYMNQVLLMLLLFLLHRSRCPPRPPNPLVHLHRLPPLALMQPFLLLLLVHPLLHRSASTLVWSTHHRRRLRSAPNESLDRHHIQMHECPGGRGPEPVRMLVALLGH